MPINNNLPTVVLIVGVQHVPSSYASFVMMIHNRGHEVRILRLPARQDLRSMVHRSMERLIATGRKVIVLLDTYSGQFKIKFLFGLGVKRRRAQGLAGGIIRVFYIQGFAVAQGGGSSTSTPRRDRRYRGRPTPTRRCLCRPCRRMDTKRDLERVRRARAPTVMRNRAGLSMGLRVAFRALFLFAFLYAVGW
ncbi:uncharacterized protein BP01DRAFT_380856 [Aspergillus saccharolyticus JOP 1030-1]|uniref:Uncharacterized protein n=1 Tax=Aspergillus saccharolyticus JOP 1030-1 TaxID=1450539 RepID=A0A318ZHQ1_9EURO|nr:hypothetical protein BP01DRAFT_380856 [Aspergillus saccharolyticus JOP 1030-1]PYH47019.1 hypothetical protein BP01DRAFT_380856 [Aspergillus saccharolyticus JOP 1030-1]